MTPGKLVKPLWRPAGVSRRYAEIVGSILEPQGGRYGERSEYYLICKPMSHSILIQSGMRYGLLSARADLIIRGSLVSCPMSDNADVESGYYTNSDPESGEVVDSKVARLLCLYHRNCSHSWEKLSLS